MLTIKNDFIRNFITLFSGNATAQLITVGSAPIIARLFTPENFGTLAIFSALVMIIARVGSLCYERSIVLPRNEDDALHLASLSFLILTGIVCILFVICFLFNHQIADFLNNAEISFWLLFLPVAVFFSSGYAICRFWFIRHDRFKEIALARMTESTLTAGLKITSGLTFGALSGWLIGSYMAGFFFSFCLLCGLAINQGLQWPGKTVSAEKIKKLAAEYKQFPMFASWNALINFGSQNLTVFLFSIYFSPAIVGFYSLGNRVLRQPMLVLSDAVQNAYFQKSARQRAGNMDIRNGLKKVTLVMFLASLLPFFALMLYGKTITLFLFGANWGTAGLFIQIMAPWFLFLFFASPSNVIFEVCKKQKLRLKINVYKGVFRLFALLIGCAYFRDPIIALSLYVIVNVFFEIVMIIFAFKLATLEG